VTPIRLKIEELRRARGWSQAELARRAGLRAATVSAIENGQTRGIDFDTLEKLAQALDVDPAYLVTRVN
jgi:transcriptional regulator with XRE-family HTH domain